MAAGSSTENDTIAAVDVVVGPGPPVTVTVGAGGIGAVTVHEYVCDVVPPALVATTVNTCGPTARPETDHEPEQAEADPLSKLHVTEAPGSLTENATVALVAADEAAGPEVTVTVGAGGIGAVTVHEYVCVDVPPALVATTVNTCGPTARPETDHEPEQAEADPLSKLHVTEAPGSLTEKRHSRASSPPTKRQGPEVTVTVGAGGIGAVTVQP